MCIGTLISTAAGTDHQASLPMIEAMKSCGTQPWMIAPMGYGVMSTPGVVIDGKVVHAGGIPARDKIEKWLAA